MHIIKRCGIKFLGGLLIGIFKIRECFAPEKSFFDIFDQKLPARRVKVKFGLLGPRNPRLSTPATSETANPTLTSSNKEMFDESRTGSISKSRFRLNS